MFVVVLPWNGGVCKFDWKFQDYLGYRYEDKWNEKKLEAFFLID